jgi:hypothetical protein
MPFIRSLAVALLASVVLVACGAAEDVVDGLPGVTFEPPAGTEQPGQPVPSGQPTTDTGGTSGGTEPSGTSTGTGAQPTEPSSPGVTDPPAQAATPVNDTGGVGANGQAMLRGDRSRLVIEIDVQEGVRVDQGAVDHMVAEVSTYVDKAEGVVLAGGNTFASDRTQWSVGDLRDAAAANRSTFSDDTQVSVHILYVRGGLYRDGDQTAAIGVAYSASTVALFPDRWAGLGTLLGSDRAIERAVLVHEIGHLFGLVNLNYRSDIDHEDPDHPGHSSNRGSVMYYAIESTLIGQVFSGPPPDRFDDADAADLAGLKSGRY